MLEKTFIQNQYPNGVEIEKLAKNSHLSKAKIQVSFYRNYSIWMTFKLFFSGLVQQSQSEMAEALGGFRIRCKFYGALWTDIACPAWTNASSITLFVKWAYGLMQNFQYSKIVFIFGAPCASEKKNSCFHNIICYKLILIHSVLW